MKKLLSSMSALALAAVIATPAFAHTHLTETNPADGATVTEPLTELTLQFDGQVGEGSFIELTASSGEEISLPSIEIGDMNMVATFAEPLSNDNYTVEWSIISADGHPLQGSYTFTVDAPIVEETDDTEEEQVKTTEKTTNSTDAKNTEEENSSNTPTLIIALVLAVIVITSLFALLKRKK